MGNESFRELVDKMNEHARTDPGSEVDWISEELLADLRNTLGGKFEQTLFRCLDLASRWMREDEHRIWANGIASADAIVEQIDPAGPARKDRQRAINYLRALATTDDAKQLLSLPLRERISAELDAQERMLPAAPTKMQRDEPPRYKREQEVLHALLDAGVSKQRAAKLTADLFDQLVYPTERLLAVSQAVADEHETVVKLIVQLMCRSDPERDEALRRYALANADKKVADRALVAKINVDWLRICDDPTSISEDERKRLLVELEARAEALSVEKKRAHDRYEKLRAKAGSIKAAAYPK